MADAGRILIIPKGTYSASEVYEPLDLVFYQNKSWVARKLNTGITPSDANEEYWFKFTDVNIVNSLTQTAEGYALDAVAGKTLNDSIASVDAAKINRSDALSREEIAASTSLTNKVPSAAAFKSLNSDLGDKASFYNIMLNANESVTVNIKSTCIIASTRGDFIILPLHASLPPILVKTGSLAITKISQKQYKIENTNSFTTDFVLFSK